MYAVVHDQDLNLTHCSSVGALEGLYGVKVTALLRYNFKQQNKLFFLGISPCKLHPKVGAQLEDFGLTATLGVVSVGAMESFDFIRCWLAASVLLGMALLAACASAPTQELSEARRAWQVAHNAGADIVAAPQMQRAQSRIDGAERAIDTGAYHEARDQALAAKAEALAAHDAVMVLREAVKFEQSLPADEERRVYVRSMLQAAEAAIKRGELERAVNIAKQILSIRQ